FFSAPCAFSAVKFHFLKSPRAKPPFLLDLSHGRGLHRPHSTSATHHRHKTGQPVLADLAPPPASAPLRPQRRPGCAPLRARPSSKTLLLHLRSCRHCCQGCPSFPEVPRLVRRPLAAKPAPGYSATHHQLILYPCQSV